jgi:hypothetical protein
MFVISFWLVYVISGIFSIAFSIILMTSDFGILIYIFSISNEHILISLLIYMDYKMYEVLGVVCIGWV